MKKLAINSSDTAYAVARLQPFSTYGNMGAATSFYSSGWLRRDGLDAWHRDVNTVDYVVFSYRTPIVWHTPERGWVTVGRNFSASSSKHQGRARWGVGMSDDGRIETVMIDYHLSDTQYALLDHIRATGGSFLKGHQHRTSDVLIRLGLATFNFPGQLVISEKGRKVFA